MSADRISKLIGDGDSHDYTYGAWLYLMLERLVKGEEIIKRVTQDEIFRATEILEDLPENDPILTVMAMALATFMTSALTTIHEDGLHAIECAVEDTLAMYE